MKCTHRQVMHYGWHSVDGYWYESPYLARYQTDKAVCAKCNAWLPLGPSADDDERVRIEIRAARFIACHVADDRECECYEDKNKLAPELELAARELELIAREISYEVTHDEAQSR